MHLLLKPKERRKKSLTLHDLQKALDDIPKNEPYIIPGDFNGRVGSRELSDSEWDSEQGPRGLGDVIEAGRELLTFLSINEATIYNTWFMKRYIYKQTWKHPKSNKWFCIDYAIMQQLHRKKCVNASVMRGAECHTDHQLLRIKVMTDQRTYHQRTLQSRERGRFAVDGLHGGRRRKEENLQEFQRQVSDAVKALWSPVEFSTCELK